MVLAQIYDETQDYESEDGNDDDFFFLDSTVIDEWCMISKNLRTKEDEVREKVKRVESQLDSIKKDLVDLFGRISYNVSITINERQEAMESEFRKAICENKKFNSFKKRKELIDSASQRISTIIASLESIKLWKDSQTIDTYASAAESQMMAVIDTFTAISSEYDGGDDDVNDDDDVEEEEEEDDDDEDDDEKDEKKKYSWENTPSFKLPFLSVEDAKSYSSHAFLKRDLEKIKVLFDIDRIKEFINELYKYQI